MAARDRPTLEVAERPERGSAETRRLRAGGLVPGIAYGGGDDNVHFKVEARALRQVLHSGSALIDLKVDGGKAVPVIVKDTQRHPVRDDVMHLDLIRVRLDEKIETTVFIELEGIEEAPGVKEGGVLEQVAREIHIRCLPTEIPEKITVDVSEMEMNATMHLSALAGVEGVEFIDDLEETIVATITPPSKVEEPEVEEETELIGEDGEPIEGEVPEGEEGEAAEGDEGEGGDSGDAEES